MKYENVEFLWLTSSWNISFAYIHVKWKCGIMKVYHANWHAYVWNKHKLHLHECQYIYAPLSAFYFYGKMNAFYKVESSIKIAKALYNQMMKKLYSVSCNTMATKRTLKMQ